MRARILVVEDDPRTLASIALYLRHDGFEVATASDGASGLEAIGREMPHLMVLDLMLPQLDGLEICHIVRSTGLPVIMLTARSTEADKLRGLAAGADDYVTKPFSPRELVARVHAVLRRTRGPRTVRVKGVEIDMQLQRVTAEGTLVNLTATEFRIIEVLASVPGRPFSRAELAVRVFGYARDAQFRTLDVHVKNLRRKIETYARDARVVVTAFGIGYRLGRDDD